MTVLVAPCRAGGALAPEMMRRIQNHPTTLRASPIVRHIHVTGKRNDPRADGSTARSSISTATGVTVRTTADSFAWALCTLRSATDASRACITAAVRSSGSAAGPPSRAHVRTTATTRRTLSSWVSTAASAIDSAMSTLLRAHDPAECGGQRRHSIGGGKDRLGQGGAAAYRPGGMAAPLAEMLLDRYAMAPKPTRLESSRRIGVVPVRSAHRSWRRARRVGRRYDVASNGSDSLPGEPGEHEDEQRRGDGRRRRVTHRRARVSSPVGSPLRTRGHTSGASVSRLTSAISTMRRSAVPVRAVCTMTSTERYR